MESALRRSTTGHLTRYGLLPILLGLTLFAVEAQAFLGWSGITGGNYTPQIYSKRGAVYARTVVPGANGQPQFVAFDENGQEVAYIGEAVDELAMASVVSGSWYSAMLAQLEAVKTQYPALETLSKQDYEGTNLSTADNQLIAKPALAADTLTVALRPQDQRYATDGSDLVLLELPIRLDQTVDPNTRSLLLVPDGTVHYQTRHNIGYRVAYFGSTDDYDGSGGRQFDDTIYAPLAGAEVSLASGSRTITDAQGKYAMQFTLPACPGFTFEYITHAYLELQFRRFNPHSAATKLYTVWREGSDFCNGLGVYSLDAADIINSSARPPQINTDFPIDLMVLAGTARIQSPGGPIEIGEATRYDHSRAALQRVAHESYDFDGDGTPDTSFLGRLTQDAEGNPVFAKSAAGEAPEVQGVWLSSGEGVPTFDESNRTTVLPDLTRLPDWSADFNDRALLSALSVEDFQNTDLYVFRESNGRLLIERRGLRESEIERGLVGVDEDKQRFFYSLRLFGPDSGKLRIGSEIRTDAEVAQFQEAEGVVDAALHRREADHLRPGESVRIVAINRASGYIGSVTTALQAAGQTGGSFDIAFDIDELVMGPPNLRIWAERHSRVEYGLTQDETRDQRIGYEGAGLADDTLIDIYTEWLDADGRPLPEELADFGYTARLAKVVAPNQLQAVAGSSGGNQLSQFAIQPGRRLQVIRLPEQTVGNQHLYVQVAGEPSSRNPDFGSSQIHEGILTYRPDHFVPVKVPVFDETATDLQLAAYRLARDNAAPGTDLTEPEPAYQWAYRPEFQFSIYDLTVQEIRREDAAGQSEDILQLEQPVLASGDQLLDLYYELYAPATGGENWLDALEAYSYDGGQELVFALGEQELTATYGADGHLTFDNLEHLGQLGAEDYLTLRLYANNDTSNVLWEWAFEVLAVDALYDLEEITDEEGVIHLSADDPILPLQAVLVGYANRDPELKSERRLAWVVDGGGIANPAVEMDGDQGIFHTTVVMPTSGGARATIKAKMGDSGDTTEAVFGKVIVDPGVPASIALETEGTPSVLGATKMQATATIRDAYGNRVKDGTSVIFRLTGEVRQTEITTSTVNGQVSTEINGGAFANPDNRLSVRTGALTKEVAFSVPKPQITIESFATRQLVGTTVPVVILVTSDSGVPLAGVPIKLMSTYGVIKEDSLISGVDGRITAHVVNPANPGLAKLTVNAGLSASTAAAYEVVVAEGESLPVDTRTAFVVGDRAVAGTLVHERFDGTEIAFDYPVQTDVALAGTAGGTTDVSLGDLTAPNLAPIAAYFMTELTAAGAAPDATGLHHASAEKIQIVQDHPLGAGTSYRFDGSGRLQVVDLVSLARPDGIGFRVDAKPEAANTVLFDFGNGAQRLTYDAMGRYHYRLVTEEGSIESVSAPTALGAWHSVAGRFHGGVLELEVNGQTVSVDANGTGLAYTEVSVLTVGDGFTGRMSSLQFYDWTMQPLLAFESGAESQPVSLDANGQATVAVHSLGHLNDQQVGSAVPLLRVAIRVGGTRQYISLLSAELYADIGGFYIDTLHPDAPPINVAALTAPNRPLAQYAATAINYVIPPAYGWSFTLSGVGFWIGEAVNFFIPYQDIGMLFEQLHRLATNDPSFSEDELVQGIIGTLTIVPALKALKVAKPLARFWVIAKNTNPAFMRKFISVFDTVLEKAWASRSFNVLLDTLPFLLLAGEIATDEKAQEEIKFLINTVQSEDDIWAWIDYFRLPAEGWLGGEADIPELELSLAAVTDTSPTGNLFAGRRIGEWLIPAAHAADKAKASRLVKEAAIDLLKQLRTLKHNAGFKDSAEIIDGMKATTSGMKKTDLANLRKLAHKPQWIALAAVSSKNFFIKALRSDNYMRISPVAMAGAIVYLETRRTCKDADGNPIDAVCQPLEENVSGKLAGLYARAFSENLIASNKDYAGGWEKGHQFQVVMLAALHLSYEISGLPAERIIDVEVERGDGSPQVWLYEKSGTTLKHYGKKAWGRQPDIVLLGSSANIDKEISHPDAVWIELKSWSYPRGGQPDWERFKPWGLTGDNESNTSRQILLDRVARKEHIYVNNVGDTVTDEAQSKDFRWYFHRFRRKTIEGFKEADMGKVRTKLLAVSKIATDSLVDVKGDDKYFETHVISYDIRDWLLGTGRAFILKELDDVQLDEFIRNDVIFDLVD